MKEILQDVKEKASRGAFKNEEQVRVCIIFRILQGLGWDIWNPSECYPEFPVLPREDATKIDVALFLRPTIPSVFIEVKAIGKLDQDLESAERQLRDYNRNNTATFTILTDGIRWRLYYSKAGGEFRQKLFKSIDLTRDEIEDVELVFMKFLAKGVLADASAEREAQGYIESSLKEQTMSNSLGKARRFILEPPYPSLPEALCTAALEDGVELTLEESRKFVSFQRNSDVTLSEKIQVTDALSTRTQSTQRGNLPPNDTKCRFTYASREYRGEIRDGRLVIDGMPESYRSFSAASVAVSNTSRNGWRDWEIILPGSSNWLLADTWRNQSRGNC